MEKINIQLPQYWKKKKLNPEFIKELESTAKSDPFTKDEFGEYRFGTFLHGCAIVKVEMTDKPSERCYSQPTSYRFTND